MAKKKKKKPEKERFFGQKSGEGKKRGGKRRRKRGHGKKKRTFQGRGKDGSKHKKSGVLIHWEGLDDNGGMYKGNDGMKRNPLNQEGLPIEAKSFVGTRGEEGSRKFIKDHTREERAAEAKWERSREGVGDGILGEGGGQKGKLY